MTRRCRSSTPTRTNTGKLVNGTYALAQPLQVTGDQRRQPEHRVRAGHGREPPLALLSYPRAISSDPVTLGFKQSVGAGETLRAGAYGKTLTFTLSTTTP